MNSKLILVVLRGAGCNTLMSQLLDSGYRVTTFSSIGTFLRRKHVTLLIGASAEQVDAVLDIIRAACPTPPDSDEHHATIFVLDAGQIVPF